MDARIKLIEGVAFMGETGTGHAVVLDGAAADGGRNLGPRPMEMLLLGLGGCTAYDVVTMLRKGRQDVVDCEVKLSGTRAESPPKVFTDIHVEFIVTGRDLSDKAVERAIRLSAEKYCSASIMLGATANITHGWSVKAPS